jgi:hypothetical protein
MVTSVTKGRTQKLPQKIKIVETYWHDHSFIFWIFLKNLSA